MKRVASLAALSALVVSVLGVPALAGNGDPRIELNQSNPSFGDSVSFTVSNPRSSKPDVRLVCGRDAAFYPATQSVLDKTLPYYGDGPREFVLASEGWTSGPTTCVAWLMRKGEPSVGTLFWVTE
jgi:hypothetical protein